MEYLDRRRSAAIWFAVAASTCLLMPPAFGAQQSNPPPPPRRPSPANRPATPSQPNRNVESVNQRALDLEMLSTVGRRDGSGETFNKRVAAQLIEDFDRLWQINTETIAPQAAAETMEYKKLADATGEIKQRATRIKYTVALPLDVKEGQKIRYDADAAKLGSLLSELDRTMKSFFGNPVFRELSPNDAQLRANAGRDLEAIINLSETIKKVSKSLSKSASRNK